jgi:uncharacterized protein VirK/YbjX
MVIRNLIQTYRSDLATHRPDVATWRLARVLARFPLPNGMKELLDSPSAIAHQKQVGKNDPFFTLSNRHYLCRGLTKSERVDIARYTYRLIDDVLVPASDATVLSTGISLWHSQPTDHKFEIKLQLGSDNLYEGGLSAVFFVNDQRVGVMSFALADGRTVGTEPGPVVIIGRNQTTSDRWYQKPLQDAFKQIALPYMMLASVAGIARAFGNTKLYAINETAHPHAMDSASIDVMKASYSGFWHKYKAEPQRDGIVAINIPLESTPLDQVSSNHRRRAKGRREVMDNVFNESAKSMSAVLPSEKANNTNGFRLNSGQVPCAAAMAMLSLGATLFADRFKSADAIGDQVVQNFASTATTLINQCCTLLV